MKEQFLRYAATFPEMPGIRLKIDHTMRVVDFAAGLAAGERFSTAETRMLAAAALLHDVSRFEQFQRFGTYYDGKSFDHGARSSVLARTLGFLREFTPAERGIVLGAIRVHNQCAVPSAMTGTARRIAGALRDADKLDIMQVLLAELGGPGRAMVVWELPPAPRLTPEVAAYMRRCEPVPNRVMMTETDFIGSKCGWVYDLAFAWSRREFAQRGYLARLRAFLPPDAELDGFFGAAAAYLNS